jgi:hypothetical protein
VKLLFVHIAVPIEKLKSVDQILAELIRAGGDTSSAEVHKLIYSICKKEEFTEQRKESVIAPICNNIFCNEYRKLSPLAATYQSLSNIFLPLLTP